MINPHPPLTGVPITLVTLALGAECVSFFWRKNECRTFAATLVRILCVLALLTYYSGYFGAEQASLSFEVPKDRISEHQAYAKFFLISLIPCLSFSFLERNQEMNAGWFRPAYLFFLLLSAVLCILVSSHGGALVFDFGAGVDLLTQ